MLEKNLASHPYSSTLSILKAKQLFLVHDVSFDDWIHRTALVVQSRELLHHNIYGASGNQTSQFNSPIDEATEQNSSQKDEEDQSIDQLEKQFLAEAIAAGGALEILSEDDFAKDKEQEEPIETDQLPAVEESEEQNVEVAPEAIEKVTDTQPERQSLSNWLNQFSNTEPRSEDRRDEPNLPIIRRSLNEESMSLIDSFIENEDEIVPKRQAFFSPARAAKESLNDHETIVTETLARIYASQGQIERAISTYHKLSLLHPEKSSYFAALIKKLKSV